MGDQPHGAEQRAVVLLERAAELAAVGDVAGAAECARQGAALLPRAHPDRFDALLLAAQLLHAAGDHAAAAELWGTAAEHAPDDSSRAGALTGQGEAARRSGAWAQAEAAHRAALALAESALGPDADGTARVAHNLAVTYKYTGRFDEAAVLYQRALAVATARGDDAFVATICHNIGGLAHARGAYADGVPWARRAVALREALDVDPVLIAADRGALAGLLVPLGEHDEAAELLTWCRNTFSERLGPEHYEVGVIEGNLAALSLARGDLAAAEAHARQALSIKQSALGPDSPELAPTLTTLGTIRRKRGDSAQARSLHQRALEVLEPAVDAAHPLLDTIRANLAAAGVLPTPSDPIT